MKLLLLILSVATFATANAMRLRDVDLAGTLTGGVETDPITFSINGFPVTLGGAGQGDITGAVKVHTPPEIVELTPHRRGLPRSAFQIILTKPQMEWDWLGTPSWTQY